MTGRDKEKLNSPFRKYLLLVMDCFTSSSMNDKNCLFRITRY